MNKHQGVKKEKFKGSQIVAWIKQLIEKRIEARLYTVSKQLSSSRCSESLLGLLLNKGSGSIVDDVSILMISEDRIRGIFEASRIDIDFLTDADLDVEVFARFVVELSDQLHSVENVSEKEELLIIQKAVKKLVLKDYSGFSDMMPIIIQRLNSVSIVLAAALSLKSLLNIEKDFENKRSGHMVTGSRGIKRLTTDNDCEPRSFKIAK